jgi:predicted flap endonuclease-1-like 5' DNA nuclease
VIWLLLAVTVAAAFAAGWFYGSQRMRAREPDMPLATPDQQEPESFTAERARVVRSYEAEAARLRAALAGCDEAIARERDEAARYRQLVIDVENNAPPPLLDSPTAPDDLKLIVGVGPVLERMLYQLGVTTYKQIARWSERDIDEIDAKLPEFPGRIRRDAWVTQARALHHGKYGEAL